MSKFNDLINGSTPILVDFYADWCGPCKAMAPILKQVAAKTANKARIIKVDVDKNPAVAQKYQIRGVPTLILFQNGEVKWKQSGVVPAPQLVEIINQFAA